MVSSPRGESAQRAKRRRSSIAAPKRLVPSNTMESGSGTGEPIPLGTPTVVAGDVPQSKVTFETSVKEPENVNTAGPTMKGLCSALPKLPPLVTE